MAKTTPWSVKGVDHETCDVAREAARGAGMTIGHWIDHAILATAGKPATAGFSLLRMLQSGKGVNFPAISGYTPAKTLWAAAATLAVVVTAGLLTVQPPGTGIDATQISQADADRIGAVAPAAGSGKTGVGNAPQVAATPPVPLFEPNPNKAATAPALSMKPLPAKSSSLRSTGIAEVQRLLTMLQFTPGPADGQMGERTVAAIRLYQQFAGLPVNGSADKDLLNDLRKVVGTMQAEAKN